MPPELRDRIDAEVLGALNGKALTMDQLVKHVSDSFSPHDVKSRVLALIPEEIELTRDLELKLTG